jgi:hypothetical protein
MAADCRHMLEGMLCIYMLCMYSYVVFNKKFGRQILCVIFTGLGYFTFITYHKFSRHVCDCSHAESKNRAQCRNVYRALHMAICFHKTASETRTAAIFILLNFASANVD